MPITAGRCRHQLLFKHLSIDYAGRVSTLSAHMPCLLAFFQWLFSNGTPQALTRALTTNYGTLTTHSAAVIIPLETLPTLWGTSTVSIYTLRASLILLWVTVIPFEAPNLSPFAPDHIFHYPWDNVGQRDSDLRVCESTADGVESALNAAVTAYEGVGELQRMWEGFRRSGKYIRWDGIGGDKKIAQIFISTKLSFIITSELS